MWPVRTATEGVNAVEASEENEPLVGRCKDWRALQPQGAGKLMVRGWCTYPSSGWSMELRRREPQGTDPADLLLERVESLAEGYQARVIKAIEAEYVEETETEYDTVTILPDEVTIEVEKDV
jgi:hypothetical protein